MCAKHYENLTMLSKVIAKNVGDVVLRHTVYIQDGFLVNNRLRIQVYLDASKIWQTVNGISTAQ